MIPDDQDVHLTRPVDEHTHLPADLDRNFAQRPRHFRADDPVAWYPAVQDFLQPFFLGGLQASGIADDFSYWFSPYCA